MLTGTNFVTNQSDDGIYTLRFTLSQPVAGCPAFAEINFNPAYHYAWNSTLLFNWKMDSIIQLGRLNIDITVPYNIYFKNWTSYNPNQQTWWSNCYDYMYVYQYEMIVSDLFYNRRCDFIININSVGNPLPQFSEVT